MSKFNVGDWVKRTDSSFLDVIKGNLYEIESVLGGNVRLVGLPQSYLRRYFELVKLPVPPAVPPKMPPLAPGHYNPCEEVIMKKESSNKSWSFHSIHPKDIDWEAISADCTRANPLLFMETRDSDKCYAVIHSSLLDKGFTVDKIMDIGEMLYVTANDTSIHVVKVQEFKEVVEWAKAVKAAQWPKNEVFRTKVTVHQIKI